MVTTERKLVSIAEATKIIEESKDKNEAVDRLHKLNKRQPAPPAPEGGISIRAAARQYRIYSQTISRWVARGLIPIILRTKNEVYIDKTVIAKMAESYKEAPGRGKRTLIKAF